jgi:glycosyltransferase involved in cell wall biosynthesis
MGHQIPILINAFNRPRNLEACLDSLSRVSNPIYIYIDGPRADSPSDLKLINDCERVARASSLNIKRIEVSETNLGLCHSVSNSITKVLGEHESLIVLEDDLIVSPDFVNFMERALIYFEADKSIGSICGANSVPMSEIENSDSPFRLSIYADSWGWGTWGDRWEDFIFHEGDSFEKSFFPGSLTKFSVFIWRRTFRKVYNFQIDSWAYRWMWSNWKKKRSHLVSNSNFVQNRGTGMDATHTKGLVFEKSFEKPHKNWEHDWPRPQIDERADRWMEKNHFRTNLISYLAIFFLGLLKGSR